MSIDAKEGIPGVPLAALDAIQDENARQVLRAIVDGWHVRNGSPGDGKSRFVTAAGLGELSGTVGGMRRSLSALEQQNNLPISSEINRIITDVQASVMESVLFKELGDRIPLINQDFLDGLAAEAIARQAAITNEATVRQTADTSLASQITTITASVNNNAAAIQTEITARVNGDNAVTSYVNTQLTTVNGNISALQTHQTTTANNVSALSSTVTTLQASVGTNTTAIQTEATARVNADNDIYSKYSVKIDTNGYVSGFGLISTANNSTPFSDFIVRANRFAIGSPSGPGITPKVPFTVLTTADSNGNSPGVYIDSAIIKNADIGTLKINGNAVTVPTYATNTLGSMTVVDSWVTVATAWLTISGLAAGEQAGTIVTAFATFYENGGSPATMVASIFIEGGEYARAGCTIGESKTSTLTAYALPQNGGPYRIDLKIKVDSTTPGGAASKPMNNIIGGIIVMSGKR